MADTLSAVVTTDADSYVTGRPILVTVTFTCGDTAQVIELVDSRCAQSPVTSNVQNLIGESIAANDDTALQFEATARSGQAPDLTQTLNWAFTTTTHYIAATGKDVTITPIQNVGGQFPDETN